jgi:hypothetical protein
VAALLKQQEITKEKSMYSGEQVTEKVTEVTTQLQATEFHPLWVAGSFFVVYSLAAILGIALGVRRRIGQINNQSGGLEFR